MSKRFRLYWNVKIAMYSLQNAVVTAITVTSGICNILYPVHYWYPMESRDVKIWGSEMAKGKSTKKIPILESVRRVRLWAGVNKGMREQTVGRREALGTMGPVCSPRLGYIRPYRLARNTTPEEAHERTYTHSRTTKRTHRQGIHEHTRLYTQAMIRGCMRVSFERERGRGCV